MATIDPKLLPGMLPPFHANVFTENKENAPQQSKQPQAGATDTKPPADVNQSPVNMSYHQNPVPQMQAATAQKGRKRTITLVDGDNIDLRGSFAINPQVIEAMRQRIFELEDQLESLRQQPPAKRARTDPGANASAGPSSRPAAASTPTGKSSAASDAKKRKMQLKKIFDHARCKSDTCKFQGSEKTIKIDEIFEQADFEALFMGKGVLIQPTAQNKPKSVVTIIEFNNAAHINDFFGDELKPLKGNRWTRGGMRSYGGGLFGGGGGFTKSVKTATSSNNLKCSLKFGVAETGGSYGWDSD
ncbi:hypothetical protein BT96DRAFT_916034 [Gymnopus androsaceus JB14]|uniref:Uncharacterized protein n=1 Tax=Gymnopus androsaceus JB14 TaxID=1447944 RepID=A0A6A4I6S3_9AGAR|nr:hypothetical protein BT96DRAFT_916034 [Gymnopus androsaceus JB14]